MVVCVCVCVCVVGGWLGVRIGFRVQAEQKPHCAPVPPGEGRGVRGGVCVCACACVRACVCACVCVCVCV